MFVFFRGEWCIKKVIFNLWECGLCLGAKTTNCGIQPFFKDVACLTTTVKAEDVVAVVIAVVMSGHKHYFYHSSIISTGVTVQLANSRCTQPRQRSPKLNMNSKSAKLCAELNMEQFIVPNHRRWIFFFFGGIFCSFLQFF